VKRGGKHVPVSVIDMCTNAANSSDFNTKNNNVRILDQRNLDNKSAAKLVLVIKHSVSLIDTCTNTSAGSSTDANANMTAVNDGHVLE